MRLSDRLRRWWNPAAWRDEHPENSNGDGFALSAEQTRSDAVTKESLLPKAADAIDLGHRH